MAGYNVNYDFDYIIVWIEYKHIITLAVYRLFYLLAFAVTSTNRSIMNTA